MKCSNHIYSFWLLLYFTYSYTRRRKKPQKNAFHVFVVVVFFGLMWFGLIWLCRKSNVEIDTQWTMNEENTDSVQLNWWSALNKMDSDTNLMPRCIGQRQRLEIESGSNGCERCKIFWAIEKAAENKRDRNKRFYVRKSYKIGVVVLSQMHDRRVHNNLSY